MTPGPPPPFDATGPLSDGTVLLEASAGTGKTHTITSLALRLVAEQRIELDRILIVTFTRAAAAELRGRVRSRLAAAVATIGTAVAEGWSKADIDDRVDDPVIAHLLHTASARGRDELRAVLHRLRVATEGFDDATIDTIHGFCQRALQRAAPDVDLDVGAPLSEDVAEPIDELIQDWLVRELRTAHPDWFRLLDGAGIGATRLRSIATKLEAEPDLEVVPRSAASGRSPQEIWVAAVQRFRSAWAAQGDDLVAWLCDNASGFRGRYYNTKRPYREGAALTAWCDGEVPALGDVDGIVARLRYVSRSELVDRLEDPAAMPDHLDVIDAAEALCTIREDLVTEVLVRFVDEVRTELPRRKSARGMLSFTDLLVALDRALQDPRTRSAVRDGIRTRYDVALIDEFQDTDPVQWRIFATVFGDDRAQLRLIGDPKQAIYGFRGADITTYLAAKSVVAETSRRTLPTNWRSDGRYLAALQELFGRPEAFGPEGVFSVPDIDYVEVAPAPANVDDRLRFSDGPRPTLRIGYVGRQHRADDAKNPDALLGVTWGRSFLARLTADEIVESLQQQPSILTDGRWRTLTPGDIAVLVRTNEQARRVQSSLLEAGVPAVVGADDSVFTSPDATAVQRLFDALLQPSSERLFRAALVGPILGYDAMDLLATQDDGSVERLSDWADVWRRRGTAALLRRVLDDAGTAPRILRQPRGERTLTNLSHLGEILHRAEVDTRLGPEGITAWLREQRHLEATADDDRQLRLESDEDAVTVVTVHRSKGLQYPVVWCPFLWEGKLLSRGDVQALRYLDPDDGRRRLDVDANIRGAAKRRHVAVAEQERWEEGIRLLYVALTRAQHRCVVHTGPFTTVGTSPLQRLLHGADFPTVDGVPVKPTDPVGRPDDELLDELARLESDNIEVEEVAPSRESRRWTSSPPKPVALKVRELRRTLDRTWQRSSFSRLTSADPSVATQPHTTAGALGGQSPSDHGRDHDHLVDGDGPTRGPAEPEATGEPAAGRDREVTLAGFPRGPEPGTFLHELLEHLDFTSADPVVLQRLVDERAARADLRGLDAVTRERLVTGLREILDTPLGPALGDTTLGVVGRSDRLDELTFDLPVAGGYQGRGTPIDLHRLAEVFDRHASTSAAPLHQAAVRLRSRPAVPARGFLTGSIDLVLRLRADVDRYVVVDYKSNWLGGTDGPARSVAVDYHPDRLAVEMVRHDYVLQYHLYLVALHRYLRWRLADRYDYDGCVAGVRYLFLRGMTGATTLRAADGTPFGVFADRPSRALIEDLDDCLQGVGA